MRGGMSGARWIDPENYHITLRFIGDVDHAMARDISSSLASIRREPCEITIDGLSTFGGDRPRALIARVQATSPLVEMQGEQERLVRRLGLAPEPRKFAPHITLARLRGTPVSHVAYFGEAVACSRRANSRRVVLCFIQRGISLWRPLRSRGRLSPRLTRQPSLARSFGLPAPPGRSASKSCRRRRLSKTG